MVVGGVGVVVWVWWVVFVLLVFFWFCIVIGCFRMLVG